MRLDSIESAIDDFREGKMVIVVDDEDRENEGDIIVAAEKCPWRVMRPLVNNPLQRAEA